jgi:hypothetical protein
MYAFLKNRRFLINRSAAIYTASAKMKGKTMKSMNNMFCTNQKREKDQPGSKPIPPGKGALGPSSDGRHHVGRRCIPIQ